ncbi:Uncharacterized protein APZ42_017237 [Daphnia magna]|uniref:Uncharacterized protein n=1 Tax=Daphnia magna TaxID=35525 RepID=A0A164ZR08_9CRUS|nr:Uncharacterized protein APZ42_017237 [Daphnia magna]
MVSADFLIAISISAAADFRKKIHLKFINLSSSSKLGSRATSRFGSSSWTIDSNFEGSAKTMTSDSNG